MKNLKNDARAEANKNLYARLRKFKIFVRDYENLNKGRNDLKTFYSKRTKIKKSNVLCEVNLNKGRNDIKTLYSECTKNLKIKCFMRGYKNLNKDNNNLK